MERAREPEGWEQLHVGGMSTVSAVRHQVLMTQLLRITWKWQDNRRKDVWHSENRTTMYVASVDIKMVFDVPRPTPTANNMGDQEVHGWITAASER